jgi:hypothetical protein
MARSIRIGRRGVRLSRASGGDGPEDFTAGLLSDGGAELAECLLVADGGQWVRFETGTKVDRLYGQVSVTNTPGASGGNCPELIAGGASNGRDALRFTLADASHMLSGATFPASTGQRWGMLAIGRINTAPPASLVRIANFTQNATPTLALDYQTDEELLARVHYDDGGTGANDDEETAWSSTAEPFAFGVFATDDTHTMYLNGLETAMSEGAGIYASGANKRISIGRGGFGDFDGSGDFDLWSLWLFLMSGGAMPAGFAAMMARARTYYAEPGL